MLDEEIGFKASAEANVIHRSPSPHYDHTDPNVYFPINYRQMRDLLGKLLTHLDAMALPDRAHKAARTVLTRELWAWWDGACSNAATSYEGTIAPVVTKGPLVSDGPSNRWGFKSESEWLFTLPEPGRDEMVLSSPRRS